MTHHEVELGECIVVTDGRCSARMVVDEISEIRGEPRIRWIAGPVEGLQHLPALARTLEEIWECYNEGAFAVAHEMSSAGVPDGTFRKADGAPLKIVSACVSPKLIVDLLVAAEE